MADRRTSRSRPEDDEREEEPRGRNGEQEDADRARPRPARRPRRGGERAVRARERGGDDEDAQEERPRASRRTRDGGLTAGQAARLGMREIAELTGKQPETVTGVERTEDGWLVGVEVLEIQRIPSTADLLAIYEAELDPDGEVVSYHRTRRYTRGREDNGDE